MLMIMSPYSDNDNDNEDDNDEDNDNDIDNDNEDDFDKGNYCRFLPRKTFCSSTRSRFVSDRRWNLNKHW